MSIQYKFFIVPAKSPEQAEAELNHFIRSVRVITTHREFTAFGENSFWSLVVEYLSEGGQTAMTTNKKRIDYREVLSPADFAVFAKLREWRKAVAATESIPVYNILTNEQMAKIVENRIVTSSALREIDGVGDARIKKYGEAVIRIITESFTDRESSGETQG